MLAWAALRLVLQLERLEYLLRRLVGIKTKGRVLCGAGVGLLQKKPGDIVVSDQRIFLVGHIVMLRLAQAARSEYGVSRGQFLRLSKNAMVDGKEDLVQLDGLNTCK